MKTANELFREALEEALHKVALEIDAAGEGELLLRQFAIVETGHGYKISVFAPEANRHTMVDHDDAE